MKKKPNRKLTVKKLDTAVSLFIRARDGRCVTCGSMEKLTNGHLWSRVAYSTRWDELNCHCQCWNCNYRHEFDPYHYQEWFKTKYGEEAYHELHRKFRVPVKYSTAELEDKTVEYKLKLKELD